LARSLSDLYGLKFIDLDAFLEERFSLPIRSIFLNFGEKRFREEEQKAFEELIQLGCTLISVGGGFRVNRSCSKYKIIWIRIPFEIVFQRLDKNAPYLKNRLIENFRDEREYFYRSVADFEIELTGIDLKRDTCSLWEAIVSASQLF
jgi:shikimate kinase